MFIAAFLVFILVVLDKRLAGKILPGNDQSINQICIVL